MQSPRLLLALAIVGSIVSAAPSAVFASGSASAGEVTAPTQNSITGSASAGDVTAPSTNSTAGGATLGDVTSGSAKCVVGDPTEYISKEYVDWVWEKRMSTYVPSFNNFIFDQLVTNKGSLNYCTSSDSSSSFSARRLLTTIAIVGLGASSVVSAAPAANATSQANTFGTVTSGNNKCVVGNPNAYISANDVDWVWNNRIGPNVEQSDSNWNVMDNKNWIMDHIVRNKDTINYCVRWDSTNKLSKSVASKFEAMLNRQYKAWNDWLVGYDCWPYNSIKVKIVGWAVRDAKLLDWSDDSLGKIYTGEKDNDGVPQCAQSCYRYNVNGAWSDTSGCQAQPFDISLWPHQGLEGGFGYDWGQEVNLENMLASLDNEQLTIVAHEIGHGFGLPDFYEETDMPSKNFPNCLMRAGSSMSVTPADGWMLRRVLEHTKSRYNF